MKLKCIAIDDERPALEKLSSYIRKIPYLELVACCDSAIEASSLISENPDIDAVFVDINMPDMNGLEFVDGLGDKRPAVVFITAYNHYAVDSYRMGVSDYLLKPYDFDEFSRVAGRLVERLSVTPVNPRTQPQSKESFFVKVDTRWVRLDADEVEYIRGYGDYLRIYVTNRPTPIVTYSTLSALREVLSHDFIQVHRSYIVNMNSGVNVVERTRIMTKSNEEIPISESYRDNVMEYITRRAIGKDSRFK